jgi:hypothetical protein
MKNAMISKWRETSGFTVGSVLGMVILVVVGVGISRAVAQSPGVGNPDSGVAPVDTLVVPIGEAEGALMKSKLIASQTVLEGLVRKDFDAIAKGARDMKKISEAAEWPRLRDHVYEHFGKAFRRQCNQLEQLAIDGNHEGVTFVYLSMTNTCIDCHDHVRDSVRIADPNAGDVRRIPSEWPTPEAVPAVKPRIND